MTGQYRTIASITSNKVTRVTQVLQELSRASLRPLYIEVSLHKQRISLCHDELRDAQNDDSKNKIDITALNASATSSSEVERSWVEVNFNRIVCRFNHSFTHNFLCYFLYMNPLRKNNMSADIGWRNNFISLFKR